VIFSGKSPNALVLHLNHECKLTQIIFHASYRCGMTKLQIRIDRMPLWRLLVALADAEQIAGAGSPTALALVREIKNRLSRPDSALDPALGNEGVDRD
jgi:hypothetical protein